MSTGLDAKISTIFARAGLPAPALFAVLPGGEVNPAFRVDDRYVVRFNVRDPNERRFKREEIACGLLRQDSHVQARASRGLLTSSGCAQPIRWRPEPLG